MSSNEKQTYELTTINHGEPSSIETGSIHELPPPRHSNISPTFWKQIQRIPGFERQGIDPIVPENRTERRYINFFSLYFSMNFNLLAVSTGMSGTLSFGLSLRDASLIAIFFGVICAVVPAYMTTWGPKTGLRQMIMARHVFGVYGAAVPVVCNLATITGFVMIGAIIGAQALSAVSPGSLSINSGIVILALINFVITFCGNKVLHQFDRYAWIPSFIGVLVALGCGGRHLSNQYVPPPATARTVLSYSSLIAGYYLPWSCLASDFGTYFDPQHSSKRIYLYSYLGLTLSSVPLMIAGAAIGGAVPNIDSWNAGYTDYSVGGVIGAMLQPSGGFGKFCLVLLALSMLGNMTGSSYAGTLNFQNLVDLVPRPRWLRETRRAVYAAVLTVVVIPVAIRAAASFFDSLNNFVGVLGYWVGAFVGVVITEHFVFRNADFSRYEQEEVLIGSRSGSISVTTTSSQPTLRLGIATLLACAACFALVVPSMDQIWYAGPIAVRAGDLGFEMALLGSSVLYVVFRTIELRLRKR